MVRLRFPFISKSILLMALATLTSACLPQVGATNAEAVVDLGQEKVRDDIPRVSDIELSLKVAGGAPGVVQLLSGQHQPTVNLVAHARGVRLVSETKIVQELVTVRKDMFYVEECPVAIRPPGIYPPMDIDNSAGNDDLKCIAIEKFESRAAAIEKLEALKKLNSSKSYRIKMASVAVSEMRPVEKTVVRREELSPNQLLEAMEFNGSVKDQLSRQGDLACRQVHASKDVGMNLKLLKLLVPELRIMELTEVDSSVDEFGGIPSGNEGSERIPAVELSVNLFCGAQFISLEDIE